MRGILKHSQDYNGDGDKTLHYTTPSPM